ncbi:MAG: diguanylate cyclase [Pseudobdellovibrionaceae bacterium]
MKQWVKKLLEQFEIPWQAPADSTTPSIQVSEEKATLLHMIDVYNKHLLEIDTQPVRRVREILDEFAKGLVHQDPEVADKNLFRFRQFFSSYRIDEYSYIQNTFDDFKNIIWDFADQLGEDVRFEESKDFEVKQSLDQLREAVESNSIDILRNKSREFIDQYIEVQSKKDERRSRRLDAIQKNLSSVKKQLMDANHSMRVDHLTGAYNRKSFEEQLKKYVSLNQISKNAVSIIALDIDFFKKINDSYGHDIGDFVLKECVRLLREVFHRETDFVARIGGEEFVVILPDHRIEHAVHKAEEAMAKIRKEVFIQGKLEIRFTVSMGIAQLLENETGEQMLKRADQALYQSKQTGRNKYTVAAGHLQSVA